MPLYLLLDTSASMCVSSQPLSKYAWAVRIATGIALAAQANMTPVGLLGCGAREIYVRSTLSRNVVMEWSHQLRHHDFLEETSLAHRAREVAPSLKRRTMVIAALQAQNITGFGILLTNDAIKPALVGIVRATGGEVFNAATPEALATGFQRIDEMKKVVFLEKKPQVADHYDPFFPPAIGLLVFSVLALFGLLFTPW